MTDTQKIMFWRPDYGVQYLPEICQSGKITHLMIAVPGAYDKGQWRTYGQIAIANSKDPEKPWRKTVPIPVAEYIDIAAWACAKSGVTPIYCGRLWPAWDDIPADLVYDERYYCTVIANLRYRYPGQLIGLDTEPMGSSTPGKLIKEGTLDEEKIGTVIDRVVELVGQVDYILPAGSNSDKDYETLAKLGKTRISEGTYYINAPLLADFPYPAEMPGYALTSKINPDTKLEGEQHYFSCAELASTRPDEIQKYGCFLYMNRSSVPFVVRDLKDLL